MVGLLGEILEHWPKESELTAVDTVTEILHWESSNNFKHCSF